MFDLRNQAKRPAVSEFDETSAIALATGPGRKLLQALRDKYVEVRINPTVPEEHLRAFVAKRELVIELERSVENGLALISRKNQTDNQA